MASVQSWGLLDEKDEQELHKRRILSVEEKPFKRITKRIRKLSKHANFLPSEYAGAGDAGDQNGDGGGDAVQRREPKDEDDDSLPPKPLSRQEFDLLKEDLILDFAAFDKTIERLQFLLDANAKERQRYEREKQTIMEECDTVRAHNTQLFEQLESARATLAQRKKWDELAEKITANRLLRPREDQLANLAKLQEECAEIERESETYSETWSARRGQFNRILEEAMVLRRQIRDEKEEVERREGMDEGAEDDVDASRGGNTPRHPGLASGNATPHPESGAISMHRDGSTPKPTVASEGRTPARDSPAPEKADGLKYRLDNTGAISRPTSRAPSRDVSPHPADKPEEIGDVEMTDAARTGAETEPETPQITINGQETQQTQSTQETLANGEKMDVDN